MTEGAETDGGVGATETTFAIVETIYDRKIATLTEIADSVGIAYSTAHAHLATLKRHGYVIEEDDGYRLGLRFSDRGAQAEYHYRDLTEVARPVLEQLIEETDEAVNLLVEEAGHAIYLERLTGKRGVPTSAWVGKRSHLHCSASGKAILAHVSEERLTEIINRRGFPQLTEQTITDRNDLEAELETIRERSVAFNDRESHERVRAVGAPILLEDQVYGAVSVTGPAKRFTKTYYREELPELILGVANEIELRLAHR